MAKKTEMRKREPALLDNPLNSDAVRMIDEAIEMRSFVWNSKLLDEMMHTDFEDKLKVFADAFNSATTTQESVRNTTRVINDGLEPDHIYESILDLSKIDTQQCLCAAPDKKKEMESQNTPSTSARHPVQQFWILSNRP